MASNEKPEEVQTNANEVKEAEAVAVSGDSNKDDAELEELTQKLYDGFDIADRKYRLTTYPKCFIAKDAVTWMVSNGIALNRIDAVETGQLLIAANIIKHVTEDSEFKDDHLFFRFLRDEPHHGGKEKKPGTNQAWSWSDMTDMIPGQFKSLLQTAKNTIQGDNKENDDNNNLQAHLSTPISGDNKDNNNNNNDDNKESKPDMMQAVDLEAHNDELKKSMPDNIDTYGISPLDKYNQILLDNVHPVKWIEPETKDKYNMIAIGAGAAGLITAAATAGLGGKSAIIEESLFGGDCLNSGCVPSKALLKAAKLAYKVQYECDEYGIEIDNGNNNSKIKVNFGKVMERMRKIRSKISYHDACEKFTKRGLDVFLGHAEFVSENSLKVNGKVLEFARCVIATGARAAVPPVPGLKDIKYLTNHTLWNLTELPERLGVIGAGPIGCEMAQSFSLFGSKVTIVDIMDRILGKEDLEAANIVKKCMESHGCEFHLSVKGKEIKYITNKDDPNKKEISFTIIHKDGTETTHIFDKLLVAAGRRPNVTNLNCEVAKVKYDPRKGIEVNNYLQTSNSNIYAAGDCCTRYQFTHMADAMARIVVRNALFFGRSKVSDLIIPWCTYTMPEVSHVGLYERDLKERKIEYNIIKIDLSENDRVICDGEDYYEGFIKVLVKKNSDKIMGATIVSENAGDQISELTLAIQADIGLGFIAGVIHPYPTVAEGIKHAGDAFNRTKLTPTSKALLRKILKARR